MASGYAGRPSAWGQGGPGPSSTGTSTGAGTNTGAFLASVPRHPDLSLLLPPLHTGSRRDMAASSTAFASVRAPPLPTIRAQPAVIDLTGDEPAQSRRGRDAPTTATSSGTSAASRPPSGGPTGSQRDVIDVDALPDSPGRRRASGRQESPEVEFTFARQVHPPPPARPVEPRGFASGAHPYPAGAGWDPFGQMMGWSSGLSGYMRGLGRVPPGRSRERPEGPQPASRAGQGRGVGPDTGLARFANLRPDYDMVALDDEPTPARPVAPTYDAPEPAAEGFTRSPAEDDAILCPNCGEELGLGKSKEQRQVWFVKKCGHVFCGECTAQRRAGSRKKSDGKKWRGEPFGKCPVCVERGVENPSVVSHHQSMKQIFM
ncbi:MAG: hypothetical protein M1832_003422 [Thelocarpon impressellum]|nr:MAG: hypothetical protein M1832_003422 [Thelocarpon impressellum]